MTTEVLQSPSSKIEVNGDKINYLWLNGKRIIGIEGLEIFRDCRQLHHLPEMEKEHRDALNNIINATLEKFAEEGICNYWPSLIEKAKEYFTEQGYCVVKQNKVTIDLRQQVELNLQSPVQEKNAGTGRIMTVADLWNIHRRRRVRLQRRYL